ncbi:MULTISPECIES: RNA polymerase sigma factor [Desulfitobacterium]|uniref:RNA polymerase sigma factor, sigma-70 family n=1 Tax=Desulfitobacterium dehalogenans (strain ATCC 51507 / DSM 9161 / JW/IU-DC1) TaxID=756499 RepID=I4AB97_DESDJ|nr:MULTISPECIES: RNA polymerase sigma factor [Desulfitobacterium]AFM01232.1 RNA polymerase sigma factor, sigma-70 family [Desulfitobacterium dehalogenans ATCC 51507]
MLIALAFVHNKKSRSQLEVLYRDHASAMYKVAYRILKDEHLAEDAVQEAFINIARNLDKTMGTECNKPRALCVIIVRNSAINIYRRRKKQYSVAAEEIEEHISEPGPSVEDIILGNEAFTRVTELIKELPPAYADILSLKLYYHYNDEEIARVLNITHGSVRTRLHRARKSLLKLLSQEQEGRHHE